MYMYMYMYMYCVLFVCLLKDTPPYYNSPYTYSYTYNNVHVQCVQLACIPSTNLQDSQTVIFQVTTEVELVRR